MTRFAWGVATDVGRVRAVNEDSALAEPTLFVVADGMGGHRGGATASGLAVEHLAASAPVDSVTSLLDAIRRANAEILQRAADDRDLEGMGTTLCALAAIEADDGVRLALANVGDSRVYIHTDAGLQQLTDDHSLVAQMVREGSLSADEAEHHPRRNILTRALGIDPNVVIDHWELEVVAGDRYVLCSDGLFGELRDDQIASVLRRLADPRDAAAELVRLANGAGGRDNITVIVVDVLEGAPPGRGAAASVTDTTTTPHGQDQRTAALDDTPSDAPTGAPGPSGRAAAGTSSTATLVAERAAPRHAGHAATEVRVHPPRLVTWRVVLFFAALAAIAVGGLGAIVWLGRHNYVVTFDDQDRVVIMQGRLPDGVLWLKPTLADGGTGLDRSQVPVSLHATLDKGHDEGSLAEARAYVDAIRRSGSGTTPTTTVTPSTAVTTSLTPVPTTAAVVTTVAVAPTSALVPAAAAPTGSR